MFDDENEYKLPPDTVPRFAYEVAEAILDDFAAQQEADFQRAWMKAKFMATAYAYGDFWDGVMHPNLAMARGWEELQIAFTGRGEAFLSGAVLELWCRLPAEAEDDFAHAVKKAWKKAEKKTPKTAKRLYLEKNRMADLRHPDEGFILEPLLPTRGIRLREWALSEDLDADRVEEQFFWLEMADRSLDRNSADEDYWDDETPKPKKKKHSHRSDETPMGKVLPFTVLDGGKK